MSVIDRIIELNDVAMVGGSLGLDRVYLTAKEWGQLFDEAHWLVRQPLWVPIMVDGVLVCKQRGRS